MEYTPTLFFNEFWLLRDHLIPLNDTVEEVTLHFSLSGMSQWKWTIFTQMEQSFNMQVGSCAQCERSALHGPWISWGCQAVHRCCWANGKLYS